MEGPRPAPLPEGGSQGHTGPSSAHPEGWTHPAQPPPPQQRRPGGADATATNFLSVAPTPREWAAQSRLTSPLAPAGPASVQPEWKCPGGNVSGRPAQGPGLSRSTQANTVQTTLDPVPPAQTLSHNPWRPRPKHWASPRTSVSAQLHHLHALRGWGHAQLTSKVRAHHAHPSGWGQRETEGFLK